MSHDSEVYARLLLPKRHGYPLWVPEPYDNLPPEYQVSIGDVGVITEDGGFDPLFNICASSDDPVNSGGVPSPFQPLLLEPGDIRLRRRFHNRGASIVSTFIRTTITNNPSSQQQTPVSFRLTCSSSEGAILLLPEGACRSDLLKQKSTFRQQAIDNALRWYQFAVGQGREILNGSLVLVTGCDMASSWGIASFSGSGGDNGVELSFVPSHVVENTATFAYSWQKNCSATVRTGPKHDNLRPIAQFPVDEFHSFSGRETRDASPKMPGAFPSDRFVDSRHSVFTNVGRDIIYNITYWFGKQPVNPSLHGLPNTMQEQSGMPNTPDGQTGVANTQMTSAEPERQENNQDPIQNQCVFLRGFRISIREGLAGALMGSTMASSIADATPQDFASSQLITSANGGPWFGGLAVRSGAFGQQQPESSQRTLCEVPEQMAISSIFVEQFPDVPRAYHPGKAINDLLLDAFPEARAAVTHDDDWMAVIGENESTIPGKEDLFQRVRQQYAVNFESGAVFLDKQSSSGLIQQSDFVGIIQSCLSICPPPRAVIVFKVIYSAVQQIQMNQNQLRVLSRCIAELLITLYREHRAGSLLKDPDHLCELLDEISAFIQREAISDFLKLLLTKDTRIACINDYHCRIATLTKSFQMCSPFDRSEWQSGISDARRIDQETLDERLDRLEANHAQLVDILPSKTIDKVALKVCLQRQVNNRADDSREQQFLSHVLEYLNSYSGYHVKIEGWMITSYEVEFGHRIGVGGFGEVYKGIWNKTHVAIKVLVLQSGIIPSAMAIRRAIEKWLTLEHPHVLQFLGANDLDDRPFIIIPYLKSGNARDYVITHPNCNRLRIVYHAALGLAYLHSHGVVHGDLKALNVLIDDAGNAVLCDFGLSHIKADMTSRTANTAGSSRVDLAGSHNWMAPERLLGGLPRKPSDIYALGMTTYEIFANEVPLAHNDYGEIIELVTKHDVRPQRPNQENAPTLTDAIWKLMEQCWMKDHRRRPIASTVCNDISVLL